MGRLGAVVASACGGACGGACGVVLRARRIAGFHVDTAHSVYEVVGGVPETVTNSLCHVEEVGRRSFAVWFSPGFRYPLGQEHDRPPPGYLSNKKT
ncbi:hypothetical protein RRG08_001568 [Elysia crispata]|uniref:Uncharacterized protein n=1 Tax=Elysia crispata TaxID=231223 RepID=A0AAE1AL80_9GAST|nr:hypothetical protein RRG08_001568 [Elysia crispata]